MRKDKKERWLKRRRLPIKTPSGVFLLHITKFSNNLFIIKQNNNLFCRRRLLIAEILNNFLKNDTKTYT